VPALLPPVLPVLLVLPVAVFPPLPVDVEPPVSLPAPASGMPVAFTQ
jgi:hypothetical protein